MFAKVNGTKIFFDVEGLQYVPDGPTMREKPVCFVLHGGPGGEHSNFLPETSVLTDTMQLVYIDDRNCGRSERGDITKSSIVQNVEDIEALRKYLGLEKIFILGHSYGGMKAQQYMITYGENLHGVILAGTISHHSFRETMARVVNERATPEQKALIESGDLFEGRIEFTEYMHRLASLYHYKCNTPEEIQEIRDGTNRCINNGEVTAYQSTTDMKTFDFLEDLKKVHIPALILVGRHDHVTTYEHSEKLHEVLEGSELHIIEECAHEMFADRPDFVFPCIREFVGRNFKPEKN